MFKAKEFDEALKRRVAESPYRIDPFAFISKNKVGILTLIRDGESYRDILRLGWQFGLECTEDRFYRVFKGWLKRNGLPSGKGELRGYLLTHHPEKLTLLNPDYPRGKIIGIAEIDKRFERQNAKQVEQNNKQALRGDDLLQEARKRAKARGSATDVLIKR